MIKKIHIEKLLQFQRIFVMLTVKHFEISKNCSCQFSGIIELLTAETLEKAKSKMKR